MVNTVFSGSYSQEKEILVRLTIVQGSRAFIKRGLLTHEQGVAEYEAATAKKQGAEAKAEKAVGRAAARDQE